ncbi:hypothetical protein BT93_B1560 [Corymbia citriodora subsp. variegata]|nr:hypothetical protein BT93_B1560 [Corymbia citriodora subsp. variegata]
MHETIFSELKLLGVTRACLLPPCCLHLNHLCFCSPLRHPHLHLLLCHAAAASALPRQGQDTKKCVLQTWKYNLVRCQELFGEDWCETKLLLNEDGKPYMTDYSNYIAD